MNTRPSRSLLIGSLAKSFACILLRGAAARIVRSAVLFFIDTGQSSEKNKASMVVEKNGRVHAI